MHLFKSLFIKITPFHSLKQQSKAKIRVMVIKLFKTFFTFHVDHNARLISLKLVALP